MIETEAELREAHRRLGILEASLNVLQRQLKAEHPALLSSASAGYEHKIRALRESIDAYGAHGRLRDCGRREFAARVDTCG